MVALPFEVVLEVENAPCEFKLALREFKLILRSNGHGAPPQVGPRSKAGNQVY